MVGNTNKTYCGVPMWITWNDEGFTHFAVSDQKPDESGVFLDESRTLWQEGDDQWMWSADNALHFPRDQQGVSHLKDVIEQLADKPRPSYGELLATEVEGW